MRRHKWLHVAQPERRSSEIGGGLLNGGGMLGPVGFLIVLLFAAAPFAGIGAYAVWVHMRPAVQQIVAALS
jgi:hypothetical protein